MSNEDTQVSEEQKNKKVAISAEDCESALEFWKHFNIPMAQGLSDAVKTFSENPTYENQQRLKLEVCKAISTTDHEAFKDEMFTKIVEECTAITFNMSFDKDLEEACSVDNN